MDTRDLEGVWGSRHVGAASGVKARRAETEASRQLITLGTDVSEVIKKHCTHSGLFSHPDLLLAILSFLSFSTSVSFRK